MIFAPAASASDSDWMAGLGEWNEVGKREWAVLAAARAAPFCPNQPSYLFGPETRRKASGSSSKRQCRQMDENMPYI
jgi:hypothetical protein